MPNHSTSLTGLIAHLFHDGFLDVTIATRAAKAARQLKMPQVSYLVRNNILSSDAILTYCKKQFGLSVFQLQEFDPTLLNQSIIKPEFIYRYRVLPLKMVHTTLYIGISDPTDQTAIATIGFDTGLHIACMLVSETELNDILNDFAKKNGHPNVFYTQLATTLSNITPIEEQHTRLDIHENSDEPIIVFVDNLLQEAIEKTISDIHIEPYELHCRIRFRRDGLLHEATTLPPHVAERVITRIKIMAQLDIAERRLPQDGRIQLRQHDKIDIRINTCPTLFGEKLVLRLLNINPIHLELEALGFTAKQHQLFLQKLKEPQGLILVTGPTGSGKTMTLYAALKHLNHIEKNISTVEDPVEIQLAGINQINTNTKIGLNFATVLRTFLRQDPDILMIGEIRDAETANIALQAAQTGHLVLATLHTNSAAESISRLQSMDSDIYQLAHSISLIIAQRLVRKLCEHCKTVEEPPALPESVTYKANGCKHCHQGYHGRMGIFEMLSFTKQMTQHILSSAHTTNIGAQIRTEDLPTLRDIGIEKVKEGVTSYHELIRVISCD